MMRTNPIQCGLDAAGSSVTRWEYAVGCARTRVAQNAEAATMRDTTRCLAPSDANCHERERAETNRSRASAGGHVRAKPLTTSVPLHRDSDRLTRLIEAGEESAGKLGLMLHRPRDSRATAPPRWGATRRFAIPPRPRLLALSRMDPTPNRQRCRARWRPGPHRDGCCLKIYILSCKVCVSRQACLLLFR